MQEQTYAIGISNIGQDIFKGNRILFNFYDFASHVLVENLILFQG